MGWVRKRGASYQAGYRSPTGKQITDTFRRKRDAEAWAEAAEADQQQGTWTDPRLSKTTLDEFYENHYLPSQVHLALSTQARDASYYRTHVKPTFGDRQLLTIDHSSIQTWVNGLIGRGKAPATVVKARQILGKILKSAVLNRHLAFDPSAGVKLPTIVESEDIFLTPAQVRDLAAAMATIAPQYEALVWLGCYCGPRIGEIAALKWTDIDLIHRTLRIERSVGEVAGHGIVEKATKTKAGKRQIPIPAPVVTKIQTHLDANGGHDRVFTAPDGGLLRDHNFRSRFWAKAVKLAGLDPAPTPHDMRHTAVSLWISQGATDLQVAKWAGHRSVSFTKDRYAHLFPEHGDDIALRLGALIDSGTSTPAAAVARLPRVESVEASA